MQISAADHLVVWTEHTYQTGTVTALKGALCFFGEKVLIRGEYFLCLKKLKKQTRFFMSE